MRRSKTYFYLLLALFITSCKGQPEPPADSINQDVTQEVLDHHWQTFINNDLKGVMEDYTEESVLITPDTTYRGLEAIRDNFISAFEAFPKDSSKLSLNKSVAVRDIGYILWTATTPIFELKFATDTFVIRDGKIIRQTYGGVTAADLQ